MNEKETLDTLKSIDETLKRIEHLLTPKTPHMQAVIDGKVIFEVPGSRDSQLEEPR